MIPFWLKKTYEILTSHVLSLHCFSSLLLRTLNFQPTPPHYSMLARGYTTIRDVGGATKAFADATEEGLLIGPRIFQGGPVLSQTG